MDFLFPLSLPGIAPQEVKCAVSYWGIFPTSIQLSQLTALLWSIYWAIADLSQASWLLSQCCCDDFFKYLEGHAFARLLTSPWHENEVRRSSISLSCPSQASPSLEQDLVLSPAQRAVRYHSFGEPLSALDCPNEARFLFSTLVNSSQTEVIVHDDAFVPAFVRSIKSDPEFLLPKIDNRSSRYERQCDCPLDEVWELRNGEERLPLWSVDQITWIRKIHFMCGIPHSITGFFAKTIRCRLPKQIVDRYFVECNPFRKNLRCPRSPCDRFDFVNEQKSHINSLTFISTYSRPFVMHLCNLFVHWLNTSQSVRTGISLKIALTTEITQFCHLKFIPWSSFFQTSE
jgi:hypothetical protein